MASRKGKTAARGYGHRHQRLRRMWVPRVSSGQVDCARCGLPIQPGTPWDLGHDDHNRSRYIGPEHQACNRGASRGGQHVTEPEPKRVTRW